MKCEGCCAKDCGVCITCKDMKKYGGPGKKKKACVKRVCLTSKGIIKFVVLSMKLEQCLISTNSISMTTHTINILSIQTSRYRIYWD